MPKNFLFYDLETSGINPRKSRIMQFAAQRTDEELNPIGEPYNYLIKLTDDVLPEPDAILVTGITPQKTIQDGITEAEFCEVFENEILQPDTCFVGFNSIRFDDEFMRFLFYRNLCDSYTWQWENGCSRWDILDLIRMTRALRPEGIKWPVDSEGKPTNRLELLTKINGLDHQHAHDALNDVLATIAVAKLIKERQPKLFDFLHSIRTKKAVTEFLNSHPMFVYASGKYPSKYEKTTLAQNLGPHPEKQGILVYDLRENPEPYLKMSASELAEAWKYSKDKDAVRLPVKSMQFNRCPAIAPIGVMDEDSYKRIGLDLKTANKHRALVADNKEFYENLKQSTEILNKARADQSALFSDLQTVDEQLYDGFISDQDKTLLKKTIKEGPDRLNDLINNLKDERLKALLPLYKARNYPKSLSSDEVEAWEAHRKAALTSGGNNSSLARFGKRLEELSSTVKDPNKQYILEELRLYAESIVPEY